VTPLGEAVDPLQKVIVAVAVSLLSQWEQLEPERVNRKDLAVVIQLAP
jgi:hypothetical protein